MPERASGQDGVSGPIGGAWHQVRLFFLALQFFTRLPIPRRTGFDPVWQRQSIRYYPLVGGVVGAVGVAVYLTASLCWTQPVAVLLSTASTILLTGAMHEDGLADCCDGFGAAAAGTPQERILAIMRDSHLGTFGVLGLLLMLALKCAALAGMPGHMPWAALLLAHPLSRLLCLPLIRWLPYVREEGKAKLTAQGISGAECVIAVLAALPLLAVAGMFLPWRGLLLGGVLAIGGVAWLSRIFVRGVGGYTGDCLGATQQVAELSLYLGLVAAWRA